MMFDQNSIFRERSVQIALIILPFAITGLVITVHDGFLAPSQGIDKSTISWIDSQTECRWLEQYYNDMGVNGKWFKSDTDKELIKKLQELKC